MIDLDWLNRTMASWYGLEVTHAVKVRDAWKIETSTGTKCFKMVDSTLPKVNFTAAAVQYIINNGFKSTVPFIRAVNNCYCITIDEGIFYLTDWIPGREADMSDLQDLSLAAKTLANFHLSSVGFTPPANYLSRASWGSLPAEWNKHRKELEQYTSQAAKQRDDFSKLFLDTCKWYITRCNKALEVLETCNYIGLVEAAKRQGGLCHRDFTYHNLIIDPSGACNIIDFDYCTQDIKAYDIGRFARKVGKHFRWQVFPVKQILRAYNEIWALSKDELIFVLAFLLFPQRYWRLVRRNYSGTSDKDLFRELYQDLCDRQAEESFLMQMSLDIARGVLQKE